MGMPGTDKDLTRGTALSLFLFVAIAVPSDADEAFRFGALLFSNDVQEFLAVNGGRWSHSYAPDLPVAEAFERCQLRQRAEGWQGKSYISGCFFRSNTDPNFSAMYLFARDGLLHRVLLNFKEDQDPDETYRQIEKRLGRPDRRGQYYEEAFLHKLTEWRKDGYRVVLDIGSVDESAPVHLVYERSPAFSGGFNPSMVKLKFLADQE